MRRDHPEHAQPAAFNADPHRCGAAARADGPPPPGDRRRAGEIRARAAGASFREGEVSGMNLNSRKRGLCELGEQAHGHAKPTCLAKSEGDQGTLEPIFEREDWTLFRNLETLGQKAGVAKGDLPKLIAKELADNALDVAGVCKACCGWVPVPNLVQIRVTKCKAGNW